MNTKAKERKATSAPLVLYNEAANLTESSDPVPVTGSDEAPVEAGISLSQLGCERFARHD
jgi:hypothetical protein